MRIAMSPVLFPRLSDLRDDKDDMYDAISRNNNMERRHQKFPSNFHRRKQEYTMYSPVRESFFHHQ